MPFYSPPTPYSDIYLLTEHLGDSLVYQKLVLGSPRILPTAFLFIGEEIFISQVVIYLVSKDTGQKLPHDW